MISNMKLPTGALLAAARRAAGLKQSELAREARIDPSTLSRIENAATVTASVQNLQAILDVLRRHGVEVGDDTIRLLPKRSRR
jgi:transcriptional regulator with XRE-family HTH domain